MALHETVPVGTVTEHDHSGDLRGHSTLDPQELLLRGFDVLDDGDVITLLGAGYSKAQSGTFTWTNTTDGDLTGAFGMVVPAGLPSGLELVGRWMITQDNQTAAEDTETYPQLQEDHGGGFSELTELRVSTTGTGFARADSGWTALTTIDATVGPAWLRKIKGKVSGGTGEASHPTATLLIGGRVQ